MSEVGQEDAGLGVDEHQLQAMWGSSSSGWPHGPSLGQPWKVPGAAVWGGPMFAMGGQGPAPGRRLHKDRFCATFPDVGKCRHGANCAFAHSRSEVTAPLLPEQEEMREPDAQTAEFFTERFKTLWCPVGAQHDWQACMYAHTYQDVRRPPSIGYGHQLCPYWNKKDTNLPYSQRCPLGPRCPYAHGAKEHLYHPSHFRTLVCRDLQRKRCPRGQLCAFYHRQGDCREADPPNVNYSVPLPKGTLPSDWLSYFMNPPRFQEASGDVATLPVAPMEMVAPRARYGQGLSAPARAHRRDRGEETPRTQTTAEESGGEAEDAEDTASSQDVLWPQMVQSGWAGGMAGGRHVMLPQLPAHAAEPWAGFVGDPSMWGPEMGWCMMPCYPGGVFEGFQPGPPAFSWDPSAMYYAAGNSPTGAGLEREAAQEAWSSAVPPAGHKQRKSSHELS